MKIYTEVANYDSYADSDYVVYDFENGLTQHTRFEPRYLKSKYNKGWVYEKGGKHWVPFTNCSCGSFTCGGTFNEYIEKGGRVYLLDVYSAYQLKVDDREVKEADFYFSIDKEEYYNTLESFLETVTAR